MILPGLAGPKASLSPCITPLGAGIAAAIALLEFGRHWLAAASFGDAISTPTRDMVPATSLSVLLAVVSLLLIQHRRGAALRWAERLPAAATLALGLLVLGLYLGGGASYGERAAGSAWWAALPTPQTGLSLVFLGAALLALGSGSAAAKRWANPCLVVTLAAALTGLVGHAYGASLLSGLNRGGGMALSTSFALISVSLGALFAPPLRGMAAVFLSGSAGGYLLRRLLPSALLAPPLLGWLSLAAQQAELVHPAYATALLIVSLSVLLVALIFRLAWSLHALDRDRERLLAQEKEARAEAERRREALEGMTESRAKLIRGFSHDVRNPLGAADVQAWLLEDGKLLGELPARQKEIVRRIRRAISLSVRLIDDLLELARAEAGHVNLEFVTTDVGLLVQEVAEDFRAPATVAGLSLEVRAARDLQAVTDPTRLQQIVGNLLSNAVKYTPRGAVLLEAGIEKGDALHPGQWITVRVTDTGPGIPQDKRAVIFQEYSRLEPAAAQGVGIGLAISHRLALLLGGDITVKSEEGQGSAFTLWLPREPPRQAP